MNGAVAVIAAHPDDEVLGCGGTLARMAREGRDVHVLLLADGETSRLPAEGQPLDAALLGARHRAADTACAILGCRSVQLLGLPDNRLDSLELLDVVKLIERFLERHQPSTVFTHHPGDVNVDHRIAHDAVMAACRPQPGFPVTEVLLFEVASSTEWRTAGSAAPFHPNWFVDVSSDLAAKMAALSAYASEMRSFPHPRSLKAVEALAQWRGATMGCAAAEAFVLARRVVR